MTVAAALYRRSSSAVGVWATRCRVWDMPGMWRSRVPVRQSGSALPPQLLEAVLLIAHDLRGHRQRRRDPDVGQRDHRHLLRLGRLKIAGDAAPVAEAGQPRG